MTPGRRIDAPRDANSLCEDPAMTSTADTIRVLLVEDDPDLARLEQARLERAGLAVAVCADGEQGLAEWRRGAHDVLLLDQKLPGRSGLEVLRELAAEGPLPPVLMVTGLGDEALAVEAMKLGAADYVVKDGPAAFLDRLAATIHRALAHHRLVEENRRMREQLRHEKAFLETSVNSLDDVFYVHSLDGRFLRWNAQFRTLTGYSDDEIAKLHPADLMIEEDRESIHEAMKRVAEHGTVRLDLTLVTKGGHRVPIETRSALIRDSDGGPVAVCGVARNVTHQRLAEQAIRASEEKLRTISESALDAVVMIDSAGRVVHWNAAAERTFGYARTEALGRDVHALLTPEGLQPQAARGLAEFSRTGRGAAVGKVLELTARRKDGSELPVEIAVSPIPADQADGGWQAVAIVRDITERKRAEEALRVSEERFRALVDNVKIGITLIDPQMRVRFVNRQIKEWFPHLDFAGLPWCYRVFNDPPRDSVCTPCPTAQALRDGQVHDAIRDTPMGDETRHYRIVSTALHDSQGTTIGAIEMVDDVTDQKRMERELRQRSWELGERLKELNCLFGVSKLLEEHGTSVPDILRGAARLIPAGWQYPEITCARFVLGGVAYATDNFEETPWKLAAAILVGDRLAGALEVCYREERPPADEGPFLREERKLVDSLAERIGKIIERIDAEREVRSLKQRIEFVLGATKTGLEIVDEEHNLRYVDPETCRRYGDPAGRKCYEYFRARSEPCQACAMSQARETGKVAVSESTMPREENRPVQLTSIPFRGDDGRPLYATVFVDLSDRKRMEAELAQAQKLESIGRLAAGIAHEINTPTQYVADNTRFLGESFATLERLLAKYALLLEGSQAGADVTAQVEAIREAEREADLEFLHQEVPRAIQQSVQGLEQVASIVRAMKEFSHPGGVQKQAIDLNAAVRNALTVCRNEWKYVAEVKTDLDPALGAVTCHLGDISQAILNLMINAAQAIAEANAAEPDRKGTITITTRRDGDWAEIRVDDNGVGISAENRDKVFDPFFTTKQVGKGTGQGLAIVHSVVVERHGGRIRVESEPGRGAAFILRLPRHGDKASPQETAAAEEELIGVR